MADSTTPRAARVKPAQPIAAFPLEGMVAPSLVFEHEGVCVLSCPSSWCTAVVALAPTPHVAQRVTRISLTSVARSASGEVVAVGRARGAATNQLVSFDLRTGATAAMALPRGWRYGPVRLIPLGGDVLAIPTSADRAALGYDGLLLGSGRTFTLPAPPRPGAFADVAAYALGDGAALVVAGTVPFRWHADAIVRMGAIASMVVHDVGVPQGMLTDDGALLLCAAEDRSHDNGRVVVAGEREQTRRLRSVAPSGECVVVAPTLEGAYPAMAGPGGAVIVMQLAPPEKDVCKVYWHRERLVASVPRAWLGLKRHAHEAVYVPALRALVVTQLQTAPTLFVLPWSDVERLPRAPLE